MGLALLHRYKNSRAGTSFEPIFGLIDEKSQKQAEILGKAMRFGAMMWLQAEQPLGQLKWKPKLKELTLVLSNDAAPLFGEVAAARFRSLAMSLEAETEVRIKG